jgi:hypothetical protein
MKIKTRSRRAIITLVVAGTLLPQTLMADTRKSIDESPNAAKMVGDLVVARPAGIVLTVAGAAVFVVSLPFTLLAGNASDAAETLMIGPAKTTFVRCLGCTQAGYTYRDIDRNNARKERKAREEAQAQSMAQN